MYVHTKIYIQYLRKLYHINVAIYSNMVAVIVYLLHAALHTVSQLGYN